MNNIKHYTGDCIDFFEDVVKRKRNSDLKSRLETIQDKIKESYNNYEINFSKNLLEYTQAFGFEGDNKSDLLTLYSYQSKAMQNLKILLTTGENNRINNSCPNCTVGEIGTFDHYLPQEEFAEFSVHPKNLIPCCSICNTKKGQFWREDGKRLFLNPYKDSVPNKQYLFAETSITDNVEITYYLDNRNNIEASVFERIETHYYRLKLLRRFKESSYNEISEFICTIQSFLESGGTPDRIVLFVTKCLEKDIETLGVNHWKTVLKLSLINNTDFIDFISKD